MKIAIMQPYFLPYLGYYQLIDSVDKFVVYDDIQYTKKGWINRNRYLLNGQPSLFSLPIKKDSDFLNVNQRFLADNYLEYNTKILRRIESSYRKSPNFDSVFPMIMDIFLYNESINLFNFLFNSIEKITNYLEITTPLIKSSDIEGDDVSLKSKNRVINICNCLNATEYINPIGGVNLYSKEEFKSNRLTLHFHKINNIEYPQFKHLHVPYLSILDVLMFNDIETIKKLIKEYTLQ